MTALNKQALRQKAVKAGGEEWQSRKEPGIGGEYTVIVKGSLVKHQGWSTHRPVADEIVDKKTMDFIAAANPATVLALLDELDKKQQYIKLRDQENEDIALTVGKLRVELEAAEKRIAELREWNVGLAQESLTYQQRVAELEARTKPVEFSASFDDAACRAAMLQAGNHTEQRLDMVDHSGDGNEMVVGNSPSKCSLREGIEAIRNSGVPVDVDKIQSECDAGNSPATPDGLCPCCGRKPLKHIKCSVPGCGRKHVAHGLCQRHYDMKRREDPEQVEKFREANRRFTAKKRAQKTSAPQQEVK